MKKSYFFQRYLVAQKFSILAILFALFFCVSNETKAQTTTHYNDGYLTVFRQSAPAGSSFTLPGTFSSGTTTITMASTAGIAVGMSVSGTNIATNSAVTAITVNTSIVISVATSGTGSGTTLTFNSALTTAGTAIYLDEYHPSTTSQASANYTVTLPSSGSTGIVAGATTSSNGAISRSENGRYILVPGFSTGSGGAALGAANTTNTLCAVRPINGSGSMQTGITGTSNWFTTANDYRGATSEDLTNYWASGGSVGIRTTTNGTTLTTVTTTTTNIRSVGIINGQLYYSTGSGTNGVYQVGFGKPIVSSTTSVNLTTSTGAYGFAISPDFLTLYTNSATGAISRFTYSGTYNTGTGVYSGGSWSSASTGIALAAIAGVAVDWSGYSFTTGANGAVIYACNATTLVKGNDNGTGAISTSTLATLTGLNTFKQLAFSPIKQTVSKGSSSPVAGNITSNTSDVALFQFNLSADEGNSTIKKVIVNNSGTASLSSDFSSFRLINDANGNGVYDGGETILSTGTVSGSNITFGSISLPAYITQGSSANFLVIANVSSSATASNTFIPAIVSNKTVNSVNYTTNLSNAGGSYVNIGGTAPTGSTLTIVGPTPAIALSAPSQIANGSVTQGTIDQPVSNFQAAVTLAATTLNTLTFTIGNGGGSYTTGDVSTFKLYYNGTSNTLGSAAQIGSTVNSSAIASGGTVTFNSISQTIANGNTGYFWVVATISGSATPGDKFNVSVPTLTFSAGNQSGSISAGGNQTILLLTPTITLANGTIAAATITENTTNNVLYRADVTIATTGATLNSAAFATAGSYASYDISNLKLWYSTSTTFSTGTATLLSTLTIGLGTGAHTFSSLTQAFANGATAYLYVTTDLPCGSLNNATISVSAITNSSLTFASGTPTGSGYTAGGTQTMSSTTNNATGVGATNWNAATDVSWTNPTGCYSEVMIVVAPAANTGAPTGDGTAYTASLAYGSGTALGNGRVVYKGSTSPQTVTNLTNGSTYFVKVFTRNGTNWSPGTEVSASPVAPHFTSGNLAVETVSSTTTLTSAAASISVREYTTAGSLTYSFPMPGATTSLPSSAPWYMTESGSATSAGQINRATNGSQLLIPAYNALVNSLAVVATTTPTNKRVMGVVTQDGTTTTTAYDFFSGNNFRSVASNGYSYWAAGTVTGGAGLYYLKDANATPVSLGSVNTRVVKIFNNKLYYTTATTNAVGIYQVSTNGLPLIPKDVTITRLTDATLTTLSGASPYAFDINPAETIMYIADDGSFVNSATQKGGVVKYSRANTTLPWTFQYTLASPSNSARGLVVDWTTANPTLYFTTTATNNNAIVKLVDVTSASTGTTIVANAGGTNQVFRGIAFSPVDITGAQLTCTANLLAFGGEPVGYTTPEKSFNVAGTGYTGTITVAIPVTSPIDQYGLSLTSGGPYTSTLTNVPNNATVYMVLSPTAVGTFNGNLTVSATGAVDFLVPVTGKGIIPVNYYNVSGADVTKLSTWGTNTNGTGTNPSNFTDDGQYFNINNTPLALASSATTAVIDQLATTTAASPTLVFTGAPTCNNSPVSLYVGAVISGANIPTGTTILAITANTITMSANATVTNNVGITVSVAVTGAFTITGSLSKIVVGNGINFIIPAARAYAGIADVASGGTLTLQNNTLPTFGTLDATSTVNYNQSGASTIFATTYGNLTLQGSALDARTLPTSGYITQDLQVAGNFLASNVTVSAATLSPFTFMTLGGNLTMTNGAVFLAATPTTTSGMLNVITTGNSNQTISYTGGGTIRLATFTSAKSAGIMTLGTNTTLLTNTQTSPTATFLGTSLAFSGSASFVSQTSSSLSSTGSSNINLNFSGSSTVTLGGNLTTSDNSSASFSTPVTPTGSLTASFPSGTTFSDGGNTITVSGNLGLGGVAGAYNLTGNTVIETRTGTSAIGNVALNDVPDAHFKNFSFAPIGGTATSFQSAGSSIIYVDGNFTIGGTATNYKISGGANNTIKIAGNYANTRNDDMVSANTTTWEFNGSTAQTFNTAFTSGESFFSVKINNTNGVTMTGGDMKIGASGNLTCTSGILTTGSNKVLLNATAFIIESSTDYMLGNVQTTRTLSTIAEVFGNIGLSITAGTAPGATTVLRHTGTSNAIGCPNKSVKRTFTITNSGSSLNANLAYTFVPANELNGLLQSDLSLFDVTGNAAVAGSSLNTNTLSVFGLSTIAGTYSASIDAPTIAADAIADTVCFATGAQTSNLAYSGTTGDITTYSITWNAAALTAGFTNVSNAALSGSPIVINVPANAPVNTYTGTLIVNNSSGCTSANNSFTLRVKAQVTPTVSIAITSGNNPTCVGGSVTFTATPTNGGTTPYYQWKKGVTNVGTNSPTYTDAGLTAGSITVAMTSSLSCVTTSTATSSPINLTTTTNSWTGAVSSNWNTGGNWCAGIAPSANASVVIQSGTPNSPALAVDVVINNLTLQPGATLSLNGKSLTIAGMVSGTGTFKGSNASTLVVNSTAGTLNFANGFGELKALTLNSSATATLGAALKITSANLGGTLTVNSGATLTTGGLLTIGSSINGTAKVANSAGTISGNVTVERYIPQNAFKAWRLLSVPTQGAQTIKQAWQENQAPLANGNPGYGTLITSTTGGSGCDAATSGNSLLSFTNGNPGNWTAITSTSGTLATAKGYMVYIRGDRSVSPTGGSFNPTATTLRTNGSLYQGTQSSITLPAGQNVLVGNVYASPIDFTQLTKSGVSSFKVWDPKLAGSSNIGAYETFSAANLYEPTTGGGSYPAGVANTRIEAGLGFILNSSSGGSVQLTEAAKTTGSRNVFRTTQPVERIKVKLSAITPTGKQPVDGLAIVFSDNYSNIVDGDDAIKTNNLNENISVVNNATQLAVEARGHLASDEEKIGISISNIKPVKYSLDVIATYASAVSNYQGYLFDNYLATSSPLSLNGTTTVDFTATTDAASYAADRFSIVFKATAKNTLHAAAKAINANIEVSWNTADAVHTRSFEVEHSTNGVDFEKVAATNAAALQSAYTWLHAKVAEGTHHYRVKSISQLGAVKYSAVVKASISKGEGSIVVYPNPVTEGKLQLHFKNKPAGSYSVSVSNKQGQIVYATLVTLRENNATKLLQLPSAIAAGIYQLTIVSEHGNSTVQNLIINKE